MAKCNEVDNKLICDVADDLFINGKITMLMVRYDWENIVRPAIEDVCRRSGSMVQYSRGKQVIRDYKKTDLIF